MKANELMIGDWANYKSPASGELRPIKIKNIYGCELNCEVEYWEIISGRSISDLYPLELTEEILVKNGFVGVELTDSYELNTDYYEIEVWNYSDGLWVVNVHWIEFSSTPESKATVSYVHQLQHLLRLCNVQKEIKL